MWGKRSRVVPINLPGSCRVKEFHMLTVTNGSCGREHCRML